MDNFPCYDINDILNIKLIEGQQLDQIALQEKDNIVEALENSIKTNVIGSSTISAIGPNGP